MLLLGLTGSIATGKSTVSKLIASHGIPIIDADKIAHDVVQPGRPGFYAVAQAFPSAVSASTGGLDRGLLGGIIFKDGAARRKLNGILHPLIQAEMLRQVLVCFLSLTPVAVMDAPLLFEVKLHRVVHKTIVVYCPEEMELDRLMSRNKYSKEEALSRIRAQMSVEEKKSRADLLIDNSRTLDETQDQLYRWTIFGLGSVPALLAFFSLSGLLGIYAVYVRLCIQPAVVAKHFPQKKSK